MAITMVLMVIVVFMFFAFSFDAGLWYFDHRTAQNQVEAAALAAVQHLPAEDTAAAQNAAEAWLTQNGASVDDIACMEFEDRNNDGKYETARVCVRRQSPGIFASLSGVSVAWISAAATATVGPVSIANVMPWAVVPPDPDCEQGQTCTTDVEDENGDLIECPWEECPYGLHPDKLYGFKSGGGGNTGVIDACGQGNSSYVDCVEGETVSGFFEEGETVVVGLQGGNLGINTHNALSVRYPPSTWAACDVEAHPDAESGLDPAGKAEAVETFDTNPPDPACPERIVLVPILRTLPPQGGGSLAIEVLGVGSFGVAKWNRDNNKDAWGTSDVPCTPQQGGQEPSDEYACGMVWGFFMQGVQPPGFLLEQVSDTDNPFAPLLIALIE